MPGGNKTGPMGTGPRTGRAAGYCAGYDTPGNASAAPGRGSRMGFGRGRGRRHQNMPDATGTPGRMRRGGNSAYSADVPMADAEMEKRMLRNQADALQVKMEIVNKRLSELEADSSVS